MRKEIITMKKLLSYTLLGVLLASLASCSNLRSESVTRLEKNITYQALSSSFFIDDYANISKAKFINKEEVFSLLDEIDLILTNYEHDYSYVREASDREGYETKEVISYTSINEEKLDITLYYNTESEVEEEEGEKEKEIVNRGILIKDENEYDFILESENEVEEDEEESSTMFTLFTSSDHSSYILSKQSQESEENELESSYNYRVVNNGIVKEEFSYIREIEGDKDLIKFTKDGKSYKIKSYVEDSKSYIKIKDEDTKEEVIYEKVVLEDGSISYIEINE